MRFAHSLPFAAILTLPGRFFSRPVDRRLLSIAMLAVAACELTLQAGRCYKSGNAALDWN
jgi:hypothetical protein